MCSLAMPVRPKPLHPRPNAWIQRATKKSREWTSDGISHKTFPEPSLHHSPRQRSRLAIFRSQSSFVRLTCSRQMWTCMCCAVISATATAMTTRTNALYCLATQQYVARARGGHRRQMLPCTSNLSQSAHPVKAPVIRTLECRDANVPLLSRLTTSIDCQDGKMASGNPSRMRVLPCT